DLRDSPRIYAEAAEGSEIREAWEALRAALPSSPALSTLSAHCRAARERLAELERVAFGEREPVTLAERERVTLAERERVTPSERERLTPSARAAGAKAWGEWLAESLERAATRSREVTGGLRELAQRSSRLVDEMEFGFLFDPQRHLFHIGYDARSEELDPHYYDLLASEARLASFLAIARGEVPAAHWLHLGRPFVRLGGRNVLLSWGATMFEYLLPTLFMKAPARSLLGHSCRMAVRRQRAFADRWGIPWGISESAYHQLGTEESYQYRAFGVPELGLRRDLGGRVVVSPYASLLALPLAPAAVARNLARLLELGALGTFGLYEALDFGSPDGGPRGRPAVVRAYMAHHQGMILAAIDNYLRDDVMTKRFHSDPRVAAAEYLLHEEIPWEVPVRAGWTRAERAVRRLDVPTPIEPWLVPADTPSPRVALLSNGSYRVMVTDRGGGGSAWNDVALTRWRTDAAGETVGRWMYVVDRDTGAVRTLGRDPDGIAPEWSETRFAPYLAEFQSRDAGVFVRLRVTVAPDEPVEVRRITVTNESRKRRRIAVVDYGEVVLAPDAEDRRHPAWAKLFVESAWVEERDALVFRRRPRASHQAPLYFGHAIVGGERAFARVWWETDRRTFLGRNGTPARPAALMGPEPLLSGTTGATLDPVFALGGEIDLRPLESVDLAFVSAAGHSRASVLALLEEHDSLHRCAWTLDRARQREELELHEHGLSARDAEELGRLVSALLYP
ncbi:MAG: glucoamylase family protein, partial [Gemmatimonadota bacterium]